MKIIIGGVRGTAPVTGTSVAAFGGDTTALLVVNRRGGQLVIDMGTGVRLIDHHLRRTGARHSLLVLMTHYHLDHLIGLPSFTPLYDPHWSITFRGPYLKGFSVKEVLRRLLAKPFWPLQMHAMRARIRFADLPGDGAAAVLRAGDFTIRWCAVHHPGGCRAYRIEERNNGAAFVYATDLEWGLATPTEQQRFIRLCREPRPAQWLFFDGQYRPAAYQRHRGWGHSTWADAAAVQRATAIPRLRVIHHSPGADDRALTRLEKELRRAAPAARFARQGELIQITGGPPGVKGAATAP